MKKLYILLLLAILIVSACSKKAEDKKTSVQSGDYIARVGTHAITADDISVRLSAIPDYARAVYDGEQGLRNIVDELIKTELLYLQARKEGLDNSPDYIAKVEDYKKFALVGMLFERIVASQAEVSEKDARDYYGKNKADFTRPQRIKASHVLVKTRSEAEEILKEIKSGKSFGELARKRSIDTNSAENGGNLGFFSMGEMSQEFEEVAFSLKKGEISNPVKSRYGYHIIKVTDRKEEETVEFSQVKDIIVQRLEQEKQQTAFNEFIEKIKNDYPVETNEAKLRELIEKYNSTTTQP
ncbi:MAG: peptidylprolyl isomerase [Thermodesulfovibrionales bacterium]